MSQKPDRHRGADNESDCRLTNHTTELCGAEAEKPAAKAGRGGFRPGAGRKKRLHDPVGFALDLERPDLEVLRKLAVERATSVAAIVRKAIQAHLRGWSQ